MEPLLDHQKKWLSQMEKKVSATDFVAVAASSSVTDDFDRSLQYDDDGDDDYCEDDFLKLVMKQLKKRMAYNEN